YLITTTIVYGNTCTVVKENVFTTSDFSEFINTMMVFPNPATSGINITIFSEETSGRLDFYDATGRLMMGYKYRQQFAGEYYFDISKFAAGLYFVRMENASNVITKSFIKQ
nr:T9SS type A sorting domain-containing protein [Chitinophagales bacterium]MBP9705381.1 T9SS type A sorting domain-containing protein [Chitinophagales bacterium]